MMTKRLVTLLTIAIVTVLFGVAAQAGEIVIVNESIAASSADAKTIQQVFLGRSTKIDGDRVGIAVLEGGATHAGFLTDIVKRNPKQFLSHWRRLCFSGKGTMPRTFFTEDALVAYVASTPGAIGYISDTTPHTDVKVLAIND